MTEEQRVAYEHLLRQGGDRMLREASAYFAGEGQLHGALRRLTQRLNAEGIPYALLGGLALAEHGYPRLTEGIDLLLTPSGLERFRQQLVGRGYRPAFSYTCIAFSQVSCYNLSRKGVWRQWQALRLTAKAWSSL